MPFPSLPYPIAGYIKNGLGAAQSGVTVRVKNTTTDEYEDVTTAADGSYLSDLANLPAGYSNGDSVTVQCFSVVKSTSVDETNFPDGREVHLSAWTNFKLNNATIDDVLSMTVIKSLGERVWSAEVLLENKNGRRTTTYLPYQSIEIIVNGIQLFKGRISGIDPTRQHQLQIKGENYSAYLLDRIVNETYSGVSIYNIITAAGTGLIPKYLSSLTTTNVANDASTQVTITKTFEKQTVMECLNYLADVASTAGYDFYVDNALDLHFEPRKATDSGVTLANTGASKNVLDWKWKDSEAKDIFNRVVVYYGAGGASSVQRNDLDSQTQYGIREYPSTTDTTITTVAQANALGDRILNRYANPYKEGMITVKANTNILNLVPGNLITIDISGSGLNPGNVFPMRFPIVFGRKYIIMEVKYSFPQFRAELKLSEYNKDVTSMFTKLLRKNY